MMNKNYLETSPLLTAFLRSNNLTELVNTASDVVHNPVAIIDASYKMLAWSHFESVPDQTWQERIVDGFWDYDFVAIIKRHEARAAKGGSNSSILTDIPSHRRRVETLVQEGAMLGYFVILELDNTLEDIDDEVYLFVRDIMAKAMAMERIYYMHRGAGISAGLMLRDLLDMRFPNKVLLQERIRGSEFDRKTTFILFSVALDTYNPKTPGSEKLKTSISNIFPESWSCSHNDHIVILVDKTACFAKQPDCIARFSVFLDDNGLTAGQSAPFDDLFLLTDRREQTIRSIEIARDLRPDFLLPEGSPIVEHDRLKVLDILLRLPGEERACYCHTNIRAVAAYDAEHDTPYLRTVFAYLSCGRSIHAAAKKLFVHHNTVNYRITKARELFDLDFTCVHTVVSYYLSCIILLYMK